MDHSIVPQENRGPAFLVITGTLTSIATLFVGARLYTRAVIKRLVFCEDYIVILATLLLWVQLCTYTVAVQNGVGRHLRALTPEEREVALMWYHLAPFPSVIALGVPKIALAMMLNRVLLASFWASAASWFLSATSMANFVVTSLLIAFQCSPIRAAWIPDIADAKCTSEPFSALADIYLALWPAFIIFKVETNKPKSIALSIVLGLGVLASGVAVYKMTLMKALESADRTYDGIDLLIWTLAEAAATLIASSIPMITPIYILMAQWMRGTKPRERDRDRDREGDSAAEYIQRMAQERLFQHRSTDQEAGIFHRPSFRRQHSNRLWSPSRVGNVRGDKIGVSMAMNSNRDGSGPSHGSLETDQR
ncbi:hypothetical protein OOU_Y34scaffold00707g68 [Pyricularia oryzae Y34]|uniref:Rhodopsin domain-containing protein n=2 Tax=Pyricularia oryzae TaxID=318829 RepID=A0AA97NSC1_PYRO3|nr:hypothetical protein OOU_Y34scaffold00707g68 [Pyricularia oryzae Y34]